MAVTVVRLRALEMNGVTIRHRRRHRSQESSLFSGLVDGVGGGSFGGGGGVDMGNH
jgi:hypothetical protein